MAQTTVDSIELEGVKRKLNDMLKAFPPKERKKILKEGAQPFRKALRKNPTPKRKGKRVIRRFVGRKTENPQVGGYYHPGNLRRSFDILPLRRAKSSVHVGARLDKSKGGPSNYVGRKVDGYYVKFGASKHGAPGNFIELTFMAKKSEATLKLANGFRKRINKVATKK